MEMPLINKAWHDKYIDEIEKADLTEESVKELYNGQRESEDERAFVTEGKTAIHSIMGPLTKTRNFFYSLFSGNNTTYDEIVQGIQSAEADDSITDHKLRVDSPGGSWIGLTEAVQAIAGAKKPVVAEVVGMATSAAYILIAQADKITSTTDSNEIGGLGVQVRNFRYNDEKITRSSNAPNKNPDAFTKTGEKELIKQLDEIEAKAIKMVAEGRTAAIGKKITEATVKKDFGRGASMLADKALNLKMIDEITPAPARISNSKPAAISGKGRKLESQGSDIKQSKRKNMELKELKAEYPTLCEALVEEGRMLERDQVKGHITMAKQTGAVEFALECLDAGKTLSSQEVVAGYLSAGMNKKDLKDREDDNPEGDKSPGGDAELSEEAKEKEMVEKALSLSNKPVTVGA